MSAAPPAILAEPVAEGEEFLCPICFDEDNPATYVLVLSHVPELQLTCGHRFCMDCAALQVSRQMCPNCRQPVSRSREDAFAANMYSERKKYEEQRTTYEKTRRDLEKQAEDGNGEREELSLRLDAEMKRRVALEQQYREQEELTRALAAKQAEEDQHLLEVLKNLEEEKAKAKEAEAQMQIAQRIRDEHERLAKKQERDRADLSQSVLDIQKRRNLQNEDIDGQLHAGLERSRHGLHRSNHFTPPKPSLLADPNPVGPKSSIAPIAPVPGVAYPALGPDASHAANGSEKDERDTTSPLLLYSTAAFRSISVAAASWSSQAWGLFGKLLFSSSLNTSVKLGRLRKTGVRGSSFVEFSAPKTVKRVIPLPKYQPLAQNTQRITPDERNRNAEYFYRFREAMILSHINHRYILRFYSPLVTADQSIVLESPMVEYDASFYAAEMLVGSPDEVLEHIRAIITHLLLAVQYLHTLSVYHLNIKPSSVLIHQPTPQDPILALLTGFSKARARGSHDSFVATLDLSDIRYGLSYMSPQFAEVAEAALAGVPSHRIDWAAVDIWSVGCVLISLLARGCDLFGANIRNAAELAQKAKATNANTLRQFVAESMRRRRRRGLPDLHQAAKFDAAIRLAAQLLTYDPTQRITALNALQSPFVSLEEDIVAPLVQPSLDDEALPGFALIHRGVPNRTEIIQPDD